MKLDPTFLISDRTAPQADPNRVRFTKLQPHSYVAGPGRRCVLWVAGCHRRCPGCFQSHFFSFDAGEAAAIETLVERIVMIDGIEGLTISGGEPFEQSGSLSKLCTQVRQQSSLSILAYSGYTLETLRMRSASDQAFLSQLDWLIDGEYRDAERGPYLWRGSANQRLHCLKSDVLSLDTLPESFREEDSVQLVLEKNQIVVGGFPGPSMEDDFRESLARRGIVLSEAKRLDHPHET